MAKLDAGATDGPGRKFVVDRRDFLRLSSVAAAGVAASALAGEGAGRALEALGPRPMPLMGVGYWSAGEARRVIPADRLSSGDPRFTDAGARLRVAGFWRAEKHERHPLAFGVNIHYSVPDAPEGRAAFMAWTYSSAGQHSNPLAFDVPVNENGTVDLSLDAEPRRSALLSAIGSRVDLQPRDESFVRLGVARAADTPKLRRGHYFIAVREAAAQKAPDWSRVRVLTHDDGALLREGVGPLVVESPGGRSAVPFSYIVISADYAGA